MMLAPCALRRSMRPEFRLVRDTMDTNIGRVKNAHGVVSQLAALLTEIHINKVECRGHLTELERMLDTVECGPDAPPDDPGVMVPNPPPAPRRRPTTAALPVLFVLAIAFLVVLGGTVMAGRNTAAAMARAAVRPGETMAEAAAAQRASQFARAAGLWRQAAQEATAAGRKPVVELGELAYCAFRAGDEASALEACDQLRALDPVSPDHHYLRGLVHEKAKRVPEATAAYRMALLGGHVHAARRLTAVGTN